MIYTWIAASDGNFSTSANWQDENGQPGVPGVNDTASFTNGIADCIVDVTVVVKNIVIDGWMGTLRGTGNKLTVKDGAFRAKPNTTNPVLWNMPATSLRTVLTWFIPEGTTATFQFVKPPSATNWTTLTGIVAIDDNSGHRTFSSSLDNYKARIRCTYYDDEGNLVTIYSNEVILDTIIPVSETTIDLTEISLTLDNSDFVTETGVNFIDTTGAQITLAGTGDQTIETDYEASWILDKPSGHVDFVGSNGLIESKTIRDPSEDDPRTVSTATLGIDENSSFELSETVCLAATENDGLISVPVDYILDTYSYLGGVSSGISGEGTLRVHDGDYSSSGTDEIDVVLWGNVGPTPPVTPTGLTGTAVGRTINLNWSTTGNADGYVLEYSYNGTGAWTQLYRGVNTGFQHNSVLLGSTYYYRLKAFNADGESGYTSNVRVDTAPLPSKVTVTASNLTSESVKINWENSWADYSTLKRDGAEKYTGTDSSFTDTGLTSGTEYLYSVTNFYVSVDGTKTVSGSVVINTPVQTPSAPTGLTATAVSQTQINLSWTASQNATSYTLERSGNGTTGWSTVYSGANTSYSDSGLSANTKYYYRVKATNLGQDSAWSGTVSATTKSDPGPTPDPDTDWLHQVVRDTLEKIGNGETEPIILIAIASGIPAVVSQEKMDSFLTGKEN